MSVYYVQPGTKDLLFRALDRARQLLEAAEHEQEDPPDPEARVVDRIREGDLELVSEALSAVEDLELQATPAQLSTRTAYLLLDSLLDIRGWAAGRRSTPPIGLGHDVDQLEDLVKSLPVRS